MQSIPFVLVHSPLLGTFTWQLVATCLQETGNEVFTPYLADNAREELSFWRQEVNSVTLPVRDILLVGHSGAGALLPAFAERFNVQGYIFVDAVFLFSSATRLELMYREDAEFAREFEAFLQQGGLFPNWQDQHLRPHIPDAGIREKLLADMRPRSLSFFTEQIDVGSDWDEPPCAYVQLSDSYNYYAKQAKLRGWNVIRRNGHHFEMLTKPVEIAELLIQLKERFVQ